MTNKIENLKVAKSLTAEMNSFGINIVNDRNAYDRLMAITKELTSSAFKGGSEFDKAVKDAQTFIQELKS